MYPTNEFATQFANDQRKKTRGTVFDRHETFLWFLPVCRKVSMLC